MIRTSSVLYLMRHVPQTLVLRLHKPKTDKKVQWDEAVVDNEHMGKKKSKCECTLFLSCAPVALWCSLYRLLYL